MHVLTRIPQITGSKNTGSKTIFALICDYDNIVLALDSGQKLLEGTKSCPKCGEFVQFKQSKNPDTWVQLDTGELTFAEYEAEVAGTEIYKDAGEGNCLYPILGLAGETGEVCEKIKKVWRDSNLAMTDEQCEDILKECGDVLYYLMRIANELGSTLSEVAALNINKLQSRKTRDKLGGSGDNR